MIVTKIQVTSTDDSVVGIEWWCWRRYFWLPWVAISDWGGVRRADCDCVVREWGGTIWAVVRTSHSIKMNDGSWRFVWWNGPVWYWLMGVNWPLWRWRVGIFRRVRPWTSINAVLKFIFEKILEVNFKNHLMSSVLKNVDLSALVSDSDWSDCWLNWVW